MKKNRYTIALFGVFSPFAYASDYTGFIAFMYLLVVVSITTAINVGLIIAFYISGKYENSSFAKVHAGIAVIFPIIGIFLILNDYKTTHDLLFCLGLNVLATLIALSPLIVNKLKVKEAVDSGMAMLILSGIFCILSVLLFAPLSIAAIFSGHVAIKNNQGNKHMASVAFTILSYASLIYWLVFLVVEFS